MTGEAIVEVVRFAKEGDMSDGRGEPVHNPRMTETEAAQYIARNESRDNPYTYDTREVTDR